MISEDGFSVKLIQHEAMFGLTAELNRVYFATKCGIVNGRLIVHCKDGMELNIPADKVTFIENYKQEVV